LAGGTRRLDGKLRTAAERPLLKKCSSDCGISVFSVDATKMQQLRMLNNGREGKAYTIVDRFLTYSIGPVEGFNLRAEDGLQRHFRFETLLRPHCPPKRQGVPIFRTFAGAGICGSSGG
jgi:hypothetical protein